MQAGWDHAGQVRGQATAGDVGVGVHADPPGEFQAGERVDPGRLQQFLAEGPAELGDLAVQRPAGLVQQDVPDQRVPVRVQSGGGQRDHRVALPDSLRAE